MVRPMLMTSKRRIRRKECERKRRFDSESAAKVEASRLWRKGIQVRAYKCGFCKGWHTGHLSREQKLGYAVRGGRREAENRTFIGASE